MNYFERNGYTEIKEEEFNKENTSFIFCEGSEETYRSEDMEYIKYYYNSELKNIYKKKINYER